MRISTGMIYDTGLASIQKRTSTLLSTQQQLSSGRRILTPSDDPVAAARALEVTQAQAVNSSQAITRGNVKSTLGIIDNQLQSVNDLMTRVRELAVQGGNAALSNSDRQSIATELRARFQELVAIANSRDGTGQYVFGGYQTSNQPFAGSVESGVAYSGDDGARALQVSGSRTLAISDSGSDLFMGIKNGNGVFATSTQTEKSANASQVKFEGYNNLVVPPVNTGNLELRFWVDPQGGTKSAGQGAGSIVPDFSTPPGLTLSTGAGNNQLVVTFDNNFAAPILVNLDPSGTGTDYPDQASLLNAINTDISPAGTASFDANGRLVISSATTGTGSSVTLGGNAVAALIGTPSYAAGYTSKPGDTLYDLVDAAGKSIFTGTGSATGTNGSFNHVFKSGQPISLNNGGVPPATPSDFGANLIITGTPQSGDIFTVSRASSALTVTPKTLATTGIRTAIDKGVVTDPTKWAQSANSGNIELRFWVDTAGSVATSGQAQGTVVIPPGLTLPGGGQFNLALNGGAPAAINLTAGTYATPAAFVSQLQQDIDNAVGANQATVSLDAGNRLVITSAATGAGSSVGLSEGNGALAALFAPHTQAVGNAAIGAGFTVAPGANQFDITLNGNGPTTVTVAAGTYATPTALVSQVQAALDSALGGAGRATVSLDAGSHLVITSASTLASSDVTLNENNGGLASLFGTTPLASSIPGISGAAGATYYDLVDATTGKSLFSGTQSMTGGTGNTFTHSYSDGAAIALSSAGGPGQKAFDYGAAVTVSGIPGGGDAFTLKSDGAYYGNGYFVTDAKTTAALNAGGGIIGAGEVLDPVKWNHPANSRNLEVRFWNDPSTKPATLYYDLVDKESGKSLFTDTNSTTGGAGNTYTHRFVQGDGIPFSGLKVGYAGPPATTVTDFGISVTINGTPASGDVFKVQASQSTSVFDTMTKLINTLETGAPAGTSGNTHLANAIGGILTNIGQVEDNFLRVRAAIGSRLSEVDDLDTVGQNLDLQYNETLSGLQDLDYASAITNLSRQQMELQAAQMSFSKISQLSLFDYLK